MVYGIVGLKTHAKIALVVRREGGQIRRYCHIGTGNYNPITADTYEDVGPAVGARPSSAPDLAELFNYLTGCGRPQGYRKLLVAPATPALAAARRDPPRGRVGRRPHRHQGEQPLRRGHHRRALRGVDRGRRDRPDRARHLLPAARRARPLRADPRALDPRPLPRTLARVPLRQARARRALLRRLGRPDEPQPRQARRDAGADRRPAPAGAPRGDPRGEPRAEPAGLDARSRRRVDATASAPRADLARALQQLARERSLAPSCPAERFRRERITLLVVEDRE